jgi:hypothetical protein
MAFFFEISGKKKKKPTEVQNNFHGSSVNYLSVRQKRCSRGKLKIRNIKRARLRNQNQEGH